MTYEAANLIEDAITEVRENRNNLSDINLSEYLFILKNVFYDTLGLLSKWDAYNFWSSGVTKNEYLESIMKMLVKKRLSFLNKVQYIIRILKINSLI